MVRTWVKTCGQTWGETWGETWAKTNRFPARLVVPTDGARRTLATRACIRRAPSGEASVRVDLKPVSCREPSDPQPDPLRIVGMAEPEAMLSAAVVRGDFFQVSRRLFVGASLLGTLGLAACTSRKAAQLPMGEWREPPTTALIVERQPVASPDSTDGEASNPPSKVPAPNRIASQPTNRAALPWAKPRFLWAKGAPIQADLNPMLPITCVTVHHDGLDELIWSSRTADVAARIELYRRGHLGRGWADIGYHLVIDRGGVLWQGRSIRWQGAHVRYHNEGNIGVLVMGNFDEQKPTAAQLATLKKVLVELRTTYDIKRGRVFTHKEWPDAQTACPGENLQPRVASIRKQIVA